MSEVTITVDKQVIDNLIKTRNLIEELLETLDVLADKDILLAIEESEKELKEGKARLFREFIKEEGLEDEI